MSHLSGLSLRDTELLLRLSPMPRTLDFPHGIKPIVFEIFDDETDEEEEARRQLEEQIKREEEAIFQETVNQAQREAEAESESQFGFGPDEVDFGYEQDDEMETSGKGDDEAAMEVDEKDGEE